MKKCILGFLCLVLLISTTACKKKDDLEKLSANLTSYSINIELDTTTYTATASESVIYVNSTDTVLKMVKFHLYPQFFEESGIGKVVGPTHLNQAYPNGMSYANFEVTRVRVAGEESSILYSGECDGILTVELIHSLMPTEQVEIYLEFNFTLPNCEHRFGYGENAINLGNFYPIACVYENGAFDESGYNPNGDPFYSDMANYQVQITTNKDYVIAGTGRRVSESVINGKKVVNFLAVMVRDFALVLSNNFKVETAVANFTTVEYYYFNDDNAKSSLQAGVDAIETFSKLFGDYPYEFYSIVQTDFVYGGMEYPNLVLISADVLNEDDYKNVIIHETAHQWWYGIVGNNEYKHPWLDEALTEFSTMLFYDNNEGYSLTHSEMFEANRYNYTLFMTVYTDVLGSIDTSMRAIDEYDTEPEYTYCTYVKGVLMYESLYNLIGQKKFVNGLQTYYTNFKYTNATPSDLISSFESASNTSLKNFFDSWLSGKVVIR